MRRAVLMISGGLDSVVLSYWAKKEGLDVQLVFSDSGLETSRHELSCARRASLKLSYPLEVFDYSGLRRNFLGLTRALLYRVAVAAEYTIHTNRDLLLTGFIRNDATLVPALAEYLTSLSHAVSYLCDNIEVRSRFEIQAPFIDKPKEDIVAIGHELGVDFAQTWSCQYSAMTHCWRCSSCLERERAFKAASVSDPLFSAP